MDRFVTPPALARRLSVAEMTIYRWIKSGTIPRPSISLGSARGYPEADTVKIERWWEQRREKRASEKQS